MSKPIQKRKWSILWKPSKEEFQTVCSQCDSLLAILRYYGMNAGAGNYKTLKARILEDKIDIGHIKLGQSWNAGRTFINKRLTEEQAIKKWFVIGAYSDNASLKKFIKRHKLIPYSCKLCGISEIWNGKPLSLQIDHINGINNDNRLENLRIVCPNCHSQTESFSGKNRKFLTAGSSNGQDS